MRLLPSSLTENSSQEEEWPMCQLWTWRAALAHGQNLGGQDQGRGSCLPGIVTYLDSSGSLFSDTALEPRHTESYSAHAKSPPLSTQLAIKWKFTLLTLSAVNEVGKTLT